MIPLGVVWPLPDSSACPPREHLAQIREVTGATGVRINVVEPRNVDRLWLCADVGLQPLPLLMLPITLDVAAFSALALAVARDCPFVTDYELGNEPMGGPDARFNPTDYARMATAAAEALRLVQPQARIWLAGEMLDSRGTVRAYHATVRELVPSPLYTGWAIHPYRGSHPPTWSVLGSREIEWALYESAAGPDKALLVTEVGWAVRESFWPCFQFSEDKQASYLRAEVRWLAEQDRCAGVYIYAHQGPFGLFRDDWSARPAAVDLFRNLGA